MDRPPQYQSHLHEGFAPSQVLNVRRTPRSRPCKACHPCRMRKVRCDRERIQPCTNCSLRAQASLCFSGPRNETRARARKSTEHEACLANDTVLIGLDKATSAIPDCHVTASSPSISYPNITGDESWRAIPLPEPANAAGQTQRHHVRGPSECASGSPNCNTPLLKGSVNSSFVGDSAMAALLRHQAIDKNSGADDTFPSMLGLRNRSAGYPFFKPRTPEEEWKELETVLPCQEEILRFLPQYRSGTHVLSPIIPEINSFEGQVCTYLEDVTAQRVREHVRSTASDPSSYGIAWVALLLAVLASGAQFSVVRHTQPANAVEDFRTYIADVGNVSFRWFKLIGTVRRSFHCLRLANWLIYPSNESVLTLTLIGNVLQNEHEPDAAWALLGTTIRLAQSIGLHSGPSEGSNRSSVQVMKEKIWWAIVWQDFVLSLCYGRPSALPGSNASPPLRPDAKDKGMNYSECMYCLFNTGLTAFTSAGRNSITVEPALAAIRHIDEIQKRASIRTRSDCRSLRDRIEYHSLRLHTCFAIVYVCQGMVRRQSSLINEEQRCEWWQKLKGGLLETIQAFLDLQILSILPLRTWSMTHIALSCTLLLGLMPGTRPERRVLDTIKIFTSVLSSSADMDATEEDGLPCLTKRHALALAFLHRLCDKHLRPETPPQRENPTAAPDDFYSNDETATLGTSELLSPLQVPELSRNVTDEWNTDWIQPVDDFWNEDFFSQLAGGSDISLIDSWSSLV